MKIILPDFQRSPAQDNMTESIARIKFLANFMQSISMKKAKNSSSK